LSLTENRIAEHRKAYNNQVREYNKFIRKFPNKQILDMDGYEPVNYTYLEYSEAERETPKNIFGDN
jgi:LemA protein